jgi:hypothetical protein
MSVLDEVRNALGPDTIQQLSGALGADPATTSNAISLALPAVLGGLANNAAQPEGAAALDNALNQHDGSILDNLGGLLGGMTGGMSGGAGSGAGNVGGGALGGIGGAILGHIFGGRRGSVEEGVGKASGLDAAQVAQLMAMLAPIVMGVLGRMKQTKGLDANRLPEVLNEAGGGGMGGSLGSILGGIFGQKR